MGQSKLILNGRLKRFDPMIRAGCETVRAAILIENGRIRAIGDPNSLPGETVSGLETIDAKGAVIVPGFVDAHAHFTEMGMQKFQLDLSGLKTKREILNAVSLENGRAESGKPILAFNYEYDLIDPSERISADDLDRAAANRPIQVTDRTGHMSVTTRATLQAAGIRIKNADCLNCELDCDLGTQPFNGEICGTANGRLYTFMKSGLRQRANLEMAWKEAAEIAAANGVTTIHAMIPEDEMESLVDFSAQLPIHLTIFTETHNVQKVKQAGLRQIGGCGKVLLDGDTGPHTAAMLEPYSDRPNGSGFLYFSDDELEAFMSEAHAEGLQIGLHCVGDAASQQFLRVIEKVIARNPEKRLRHRIEHFSFGTPDQVRQARRLGVGVSTQPGFNHFWDHETYIEILGEARAGRVDPIASVMNGNVAIAFGSDCTVTPCSPLLGIHAAVNHSLEKERISADRALIAHTFGGAYLGRNETDRGTIAVGKVADLVFLEADPAEVPASEIKEIPVLRTLCGGETAFLRK